MTPDPAEDGDQLRATAAMIQSRWPGRWKGNLARRLEELAWQIGRTPPDRTPPATSQRWERNE